MTLAPVAVALDGPDLATITGWAAAAGPHVSTMKVGLETYLRDGDAAVHAAREASGGRDVFLDLKLHDIPNTMVGAIRSARALGARFITVHAGSGVAHLRACVDAAGPQLGILAVTVLTSQDATACAEAGHEVGGAGADRLARGHDARREGAGDDRGRARTGRQRRGGLR